MSTYTFAIFVSDYQCKASEKNITGEQNAFRVVACASDLSKFTYGLKLAEDAAQAAQDRFKVPYPLIKLGKNFSMF